MIEKIKIDNDYTKEEELRIEEDVKKTKKKIKTGLIISVVILLIVIFLVITKGSKFFDIMGI